MKKIKLLALFFAVFASVSAQYQEGDVFEKDGLKATIIHIDEDENRALILYYPLNLDVWTASQAGLQKGGIVKALKAEEYEGYDKLVFGLSGEESKKEKKNKEKLVRGYAKALLGKTTNNGQENMKIVEQYCKDNNLKLEEAFPAFAWAKNLGEDWFIPGNAEAAYYVKLRYGVEPGKDNKEPAKEASKREVEIAKKLQTGDALLPSSIMTSTVGEHYIKQLYSRVTFYEHVNKITNNGTFKSWWDFVSVPYYQMSRVCAVSYVDLD